jgi:neutral amino acid transport system permease protein
MDRVAFANLVLNGFNEGLTIALAAIAMTLVFGVARFANAATGDLMAFGAYAALLGNAVLKLPFLPSVLTAAIVSAVLAFASYRLVFIKLQNCPGVMSLLASVGVALVIRGFLVLLAGHEQRTYDLPLERGINLWGTGMIVQPFDLYIMAAACILIVGTFLVLHGTALGRRMRAVADNPILAQASGIRRARVLMHLWLMTGAICACAGFFIGARSVLTPDFGFDVLLPVFTAAVLGGLGNPLGAVLGGIAIGILQEVSAPFVGASYKLAIGFLVLLLLLLLRPQGILGRAQVVR